MLRDDRGADREYDVYNFHSVIFWLLDSDDYLAAQRPEFGQRFLRLTRLNGF